MIIAVVFGTRPEAIKLAPVIKALERRPGTHAVVISTGQHREILDQVCAFFGIEPDYDLGIMVPGQDLFYITNAVLATIQGILDSEKPDLVIVQGDTTTAFAAALAAFYLQTPVAHVEAGLRTADKRLPYPEEMNRRLITQLADLHFAPTPSAAANLRREVRGGAAVYVTGNTVVDAMIMAGDRLPERDTKGKKPVLLTVHRRENMGAPLKRIYAAVKEICSRNPNAIFCYPAHPRTTSEARAAFAGIEQVSVMEPLDYPGLLGLMKSCYLVMTDSGGIQEEAPGFKKPVVVVREETERPELIECGGGVLSGTDTQTIVEAVDLLLCDPGAYGKMIAAKNPFGDGNAAERILDIIEGWGTCRR